MYNSKERIYYIAEYISAYENKIKLLNSEGLFDAAKMFELFAIEVGSLYFGQRLHNLNLETPNYTAVDLISEDSSFYVQVSTAADIPNKIKCTLEKIKNSKNQEINSIRCVKFIVLNNDSIVHVKDLCGSNQIGSVEFIKDNDLISTKKILDKATSDLEFQIKLYNLLKSEENSFDNLSKFKKALKESKIILNDIDCKINGEYEIDRHNLLEQIKNESHKNISVQGNAGSGKTVLCKKLIESERNVLFARAERFLEETDVNNIWGFDISEALKYLAEKPLTIFIDSLEFIADNRTKLDLLHILYNYTQNYSNIKIITSCRTSDKSAFMKLEGNYNIVSYEVPDLNGNQIASIAKTYPIINQMLKIEAYKKFLTSPLYINLIATKINSLNGIDENNFRNYIWENIICGNNSQYKETINKIVFNRAKALSVGVNANEYDKHIIDKLISDDIIIKNQNTIRIKYDMFEDICFEQYFDAEFENCRGDYETFFNNIENLGLCVYRRYQIWIENKLFTKNSRDKFLYELNFSDKIPALWKRQTQIGIVKSRHSTDFFDEYESKIIESDLLKIYIELTNLYAFEINSNSLPKYIIELNACGIGRKCLIHSICKNKWHENNNENFNKIYKLCNDYTKSHNIERDTAEECVVILSYCIDYYSSDMENYHTKDTIINLLAPIYRLANYAKNFIENLWKKLYLWYKSTDQQKSFVAEKIIGYTLKWEHFNLAKFMPKQLCSLAEFYWTFPWSKRGDFDFWEQDPIEDLPYLYGLNENARHYEHSRESVFYSNFFCKLFSENFWIGLDWAIRFVNKSVNKLNNKAKEKITSYTIYFSDNDIVKNYLGNGDMWLATSKEYLMPRLISDLIYCLKIVIRDTIKNYSNNEDGLKKLTNKIKSEIYHKANNIALLAIISDIGLEFYNILPGYALDLTSNIYLIMSDITRLSNIMYNPVKNMLEDQVWCSVGLPIPNKRYDNFNDKIDLSDYFIKTFLCGNTLLRDKCCKILDYLYSSTPNDEEHAREYLQIQNIDIRNSKATIRGNCIAIEPTITGVAKELQDGFEITKTADLELNEFIEKYNEAINNKSIATSDLIKVIKTISEKKDLTLIPFGYEHTQMTCIALALSRNDLDIQNRVKYCQIWIDGINRFFDMGNLYFDFNTVTVLFSQLNCQITDDVKNEIKKLILDCVIYKSENGIIDKISNFAHEFLNKNTKLAVAIFNTMVKMAESIKKQERQNTEEIIEEYLYKERSLDLSNFQMSEHDIGFMSYAINCGITLSNRVFESMVKKYLVELIEQNNNLANSYKNYDELLDVYESNEASALFKRELLSGVEQANIVLDIMFDNIDFDKFNRITIEFYQEIFGVMLSYYFDAYNDNTLRTIYEKIIYALENKITKIKNEEVRQQLYKSLTFSLTNYGGLGDWSTCQSGYSYQDKQFLNRMFSKYGGYHLEDMIRTIFKLHVDKLLPEILLSVYIAFNKCIDIYGQEQFANIIHSNSEKILMFITKIFLDHSDVIKNDKDLNNAFEKILLIISNLGYAEASVMLDEYRIH